MNAEYEMARGVVVDEPQARALLFAGIREGLLDGEPSIGDGFVQHLLGHPPEEAALSEALEQLVLGKRVFVPFELPPDWKGALFERGVICSAPARSEESLPEVTALHSSIVLGMLQARGFNWTEEELQARYLRFLESYERWTQVKGDKSFEHIELKAVFAELLGGHREEYSPEQLDAWRRLQTEHEQLRPVLNSLSAYQRVVQASLEAGALCSLPVSTSGLSQLDTGADVKASIYLLRVVCRELRRVPIATTLQGTIELAESSAADALRQKLEEWTAAVRLNPLFATDVVLGEVQYARKALLTANRFSRVGEWSTWIGIPAATVSPFLTDPAVTGAGIALAVAGGLALGAQKLVERMNKWAMYG